MLKLEMVQIKRKLLIQRRGTENKAGRHKFFNNNMQITS